MATKGAFDVENASPEQQQTRLQKVGRALSAFVTRGDEIRPYRSCKDTFHDLVPMKFIYLVIFCVVSSVLIEVFVSPEFEVVAKGSPCTIVGGADIATCEVKNGSSFIGECASGLTPALKGTKPCPLTVGEYRAPAKKWQAYLVMNAIILAVAAIVLGAPMAEALLVVDAIFVFTKVVTEKEALAGFGQPGVVACALLFILATAVERSGLLEPVVDMLMGDGHNPGMSRIRIIIPAMFMSGFINNTPLTAMLQPFVVGWANRRGLDPMDFAMPVCFAIIVGGSCSTIGSSPNFVVAGIVNRKMDMNMFYPAPLAFFNFVAYVVYVWVLGPFLVKASDRPVSKEKGEVAGDELYTLKWVVKDDAELVGSTWRNRGLHRLPSARLQKVMRPRSARRPRENDGFGADASDDLTTREMRGADEVITVSDARDVARLRHVRGLMLEGDAGEAVRRLGSRRRERCLFECLLQPGVDASTMSPKGEAVAPDDFRGALLTFFGAALIGFRGEAPEGMGPPASKSSGDGVGRILLIEADVHGFEAKTEGVFSMCRPVPKSTPPRIGRRADPLRAYLSVAIALLVVSTSVAISIPQIGLGEVWLKSAPLATMCVMAAAFIIIFDVLTFKEAMLAINVKAFLGIAASVGLGTAMEKTGVARTIAGSLVALSTSAGFGTIGVCAGMLIAGGLVTQVVSGTAVAVLMMPIAESICETQGIDSRIMGVIVIFAANWAFATPFGTPSNLMTMTPMGPGEPAYTFADYVRFGGPLQLVLIVVTIIGLGVLHPDI